MSCFDVKILDPSINTIEIETCVGDQPASIDILTYDNTSILEINHCVALLPSEISELITVKDIIAGSGISVNDSSGIYTVSLSNPTIYYSGIVDFLESVQDVIGNSGLVGGNYINVNYNDSTGYTTVSATGLQPSGNYSSVGHSHNTSDITNFNSSVSGLLPSVTGTGYVSSSFSNNLYTISVTGLQPSGNYSLVGHSHVSNDITDFNTSVSGLLIPYAQLNSPSFSGVPTVPTAASGTNTNQIASTSFVRTEISNLVDSAPSTLDTLNELAAALGDDPNFATTITNTLAGKASLSGAIFTGPVTIPSGTGNFNSLTVNGVNVSVSGHTHLSTDITDSTSFGRNLLTADSYASQNFLLWETLVFDVINPFTAKNGGHYVIRAGTGLYPTATSIVLDPTSAVAGDFYVVWNQGGVSFQIGGIEYAGNASKGAMIFRVYRPSFMGGGEWETQILNNHTHTSSQITDFNSAVSGILPTINNSGDNRILTSNGTSTGIDAESYLTFIYNSMLQRSSLSVSGELGASTNLICGTNGFASDSLNFYIDDFRGASISYNPPLSIATNWQNGLVFNTTSGNMLFYGKKSPNPFVTTPDLVITSGAIGINKFPATINYTLDVGGSGNFNGLYVSGIPVSISGHTHSSSDIIDFNTVVSGLIPVKHIVSGTDISVTNISGIYTINSTVNTAAEAASLVTTVFNKTGSPIPKMSAVYINGGQGDMPTISLAIATSDMTSASTYGLTYETIPNMSTGKVIVFGVLSGLNTDQFNPTAPNGDVNGQVLYLSPTTSGALTLTKPSAPNHIVAIGTVVRTHQNEGVIEVRVQNGFELEELHNVAISGALDNQVLVYQTGVNNLWQNTTLSSSYISDFNSAVSGLLPTISNNGDNRILTSDGTTYGIVAESGFTFDTTTSTMGIVYDPSVGNSGLSALLNLAAYDTSEPVVGGRIQFIRNRGTQDSPSGVISGDTLSAIRTAVTLDNSGVNRIVARILTQADGEPSGLNLYAPTKMIFNTSSGPDRLDNSLVLGSDGQLYTNGYLQITQTNNRLDPNFDSGKNNALGVYATPSGLLGSSSGNVIYNIASNLSPISPNSNHNMNYVSVFGQTYSELPSGVTNSGAIVGGYFGALRNSRGANVGNPWYDDNGTLAYLYGTIIFYGNNVGLSGVGGPAPTGVNPYTENAIGLYIYPQKNYGTINNAYDLYIADTNYNTGTINNHYSIYQDSTNPNYFRGSLTIDDGLSSPTPIFNLGSVSGNISINYDINKQIQTATLNGTSTNFTLGSNWPSTYSADVILDLTISSTTTILWDIVDDWYNPVPTFGSGRYLILLRSMGSSLIQGHYIGEKTN